MYDNIVCNGQAYNFLAGKANLLSMLRERFTSPTEQKQLEKAGSKWQVVRCDFAQAAGVRGLLLSSACVAEVLRGFWHAAGVLSDALLARQDSTLMQRVYSAKADASRIIHASCLGRQMHAFMLFSSIAALQGGSGQVNYSAANASLDMLAVCRRSAGQFAVSTQWGAWAEIGMAANELVSERMKASGLGLIGLAQGLDVLHKALAPLSATVSAVLVLQWSKVLSGDVPAFLSAFAPRESAARSVAQCKASAVSSNAVGLSTVLELVTRTVASQEFEPPSARVLSLTRVCISCAAGKRYGRR